MSTPNLNVVEQFQKVRSRSLQLCRHLSPEDMLAQSMPDASPAKWHLAHTSWFFETFILKVHSPDYQLFDDAFPHLFNSYYVSAGSRYLRPDTRWLFGLTTLHHWLDDMGLTALKQLEHIAAKLKQKE